MTRNMAPSTMPPIVSSDAGPSHDTLPFSMIPSDEAGPSSKKQKTETKSRRRIPPRDTRSMTRNIASSTMPPIVSSGAGPSHDSPRSTAASDTLYDLAIAEGYTPEFLKKVLRAEDHRKIASRGSSTGQGTSSNNLRIFLEELVDVPSYHRREKVCEKIAAQNLEIRNRIDMDLIARLLGGHCYSACVASASTFLNDIVGGQPLGNTWQTLDRFLKNQSNKRNKHENVATHDHQKAKTLYFTDTHISQFPFAGALKTSTDVIQEIASLFRGIQDPGAERSLTELWVQSASNQSLIKDMSGRWPWLVDNAKEYEKRTRSKRKRVLRSD